MELTAAEPRRKGLVQLYLDGEPGPKIDKEVFLLSRRKPGDFLTSQELEELVERSDARRAREKALYLLEHRSHSKRELTEKVTRSGTSREAAQAAADRLEELGLLDDGAYARDLARELVERKRYGLRRVRQELARKGISRELVEEILPPTGRMGTPFGKILPRCWSGGIPCGSRTRKSDAGLLRRCSDWGIPMTRFGRP